MSIRELPKLKKYVVDYKYTDKYGVWNTHRIFDDKLAAISFNKLVRQQEIIYFLIREDKTWDYQHYHKKQILHQLKNLL